MFKHLWVERSYYLAKPKKKVDSTLAADIVPNVFAGEGEEGEEETIGGLYCSGWNSVRNSEETQCLEEISRGKCRCSLSSSSNC